MIISLPTDILLIKIRRKHTHINWCLKQMPNLAHSQPLGQHTWRYGYFFMSRARTAMQRGLHIIARSLVVRDLTCDVAPGSVPCLDLAWEVEHPAYPMSQETLLARGSFRLCCWRLFYSFKILSSMRIWRGKQKALEKW